MQFENSKSVKNIFVNMILLVFWSIWIINEIAFINTGACREKEKGVWQDFISDRFSDSIK